MCGIVGLISNEQSVTVIDELVNSIQHRGPDGFGSFKDRSLILGHTRLAIQDLSENGSQPMYSECGNYVLVFNGEIYNHIEIREMLKDKYSFTSLSDTETLLYAYIEFGEDVLNMLNGIFAFSIYNKLSEELFIARDQFGVKPLYYYSDSNLFWFGSEIKSILSLNIEKEIKIESLVNYLMFLYSPGEKTPFEGVLKLPPGHFIKLNCKDFSKYFVIKYYEIPFKGVVSKRTEKELIDELEEKLLKAVDRQMISDVPVGFFLSGGLDSSAIVAMARKLHPERQFNCYTIKSDPKEKQDEGFSDDLHYARKVANHLKVDLIEVDSTVDIVKDFDKMIFHLDEPLADPAPLNVLNICKRANQDGCKVLLGGTAGDDLFSGYRRHQAIKAQKYINILPVAVRNAIKNFGNKLSVEKSSVRRFRKLTENIHLSEQERLIRLYTWIDKRIIENLFSNTYKDIVANYDPYQLLSDSLNNIPEEKQLLNKMLYLEMKFFLTDHNLIYTDKMSMATGVEVRVPFLDKELVEFSCTIPTDLKLKGINTKYILKKVMEKYLPKDVIYRPKAGFGAPVRSWIMNDMDSIVNDYLSDESVFKRGFFSFYDIKSLIDDNKSGKLDASYTIWALLSIESWMRQFFDSKK